MSHPQNKQDKIRHLIETILYAMVDREEDVKINEVRGERVVIFEVEVHESDMGHLIGKIGKNAEAIRTVLNAACKKLSVKYQLEILTKDHRRYA